MGVFLLGCFVFDVEFDDGVSFSCHGGFFFKGGSHCIFNTGRGFGSGEAEACLLEVLGMFIFLQP